MLPETDRRLAGLAGPGGTALLPLPLQHTKNYIAIIAIIIIITTAPLTEL